MNNGNSDEKKDELAWLSSALSGSETDKKPFGVGSTPDQPTPSRSMAGGIEVELAKMNGRLEVIDTKFHGKLETLDAKLGGFLTTAEAHRQTVLAMVNAIPARSFRAMIAALTVLAGVILAGVKLLDYIYPPTVTLSESSIQAPLGSAAPVSAPLESSPINIPKDQVDIGDSTGEQGVP